MARKLEDILRARGYSDADLEAMKTLLDDPKFRGSLEGELGAVESERDKFRDESAEWARWHQETALPKLQAALDNEQAARAEAAGFRERMKTLQEQGLVKLAESEGEKPEKKPEAVEFDPKKYNLVTRDDVMSFAEVEGEAIAMAQDVAAEHSALGLGPLNFRKLRAEAKAAKVPLDKFWEQTYKVPERRAELERKREADAEKKIREDERSKVVAEFANPQTRPGLASRSPFIPLKSVEGKQPWELDRNARKVERVTAAATKLLQ